MSRFTLTSISTIVRTKLLFGAVRAGFAVGSRLAPQLTTERAARLFCTPMDSSRRRARATLIEAGTEGELTVDGQRIATYVWGSPRDQPYVLFAHGWSSHGTRILPWLHALREAGYSVVTFDQLAHGKSDGQLATLPGFFKTLMAIGRHYGPAAAVIGHSLGGAATMLALARGMQADRAILIAAAADPVAAAHRFARTVGLAEHLCQRMFEWFESRIGIRFEDQQAHRNVSAIGCPALIVHDLYDRDVPWSEGERYARYWPAARLLTTQGLGHRRILDDSGVIDAGLRFLRGETVGERVVSSPNLPLGFA